MAKYYYENLLSNQNVTATTNVTWVADLTTLRLFRDQKAFVFLCVDIHTNYIVAALISKQTITTQSIIRSLERSIHQRLKIPGKRNLIIHTDRGTQFSSKSYNTFTKKHNEYFTPSMARQNTPTNNPVAERFIRTFKNHKIYNTTIEEELSNRTAIDPNFRSYRATLNKYVESLNSKPNKKSLVSPQRQDTDVTTASMLMVDPIYVQAKSKHVANDFRTDEVEKFKAENSKVIGLLAELAARKAELVENTPFDNFENDIALQVIDNRLNEIYTIIQNNPQVTRKYVEEAIEPIEDSLSELHNKVDQLLSKGKKCKETLPLRDPIDTNLFLIFLTNAGSALIRQKDLKQAQLRIAYTLLYYTGLRINEIRQVTHKTIIDAIASSQINVIHHKTKQAHIHVLSKIGVKKLKELSLEFTIVFDKYRYKSLFGKSKPIHQKALIRFINNDLKNTCQVIKWLIVYGDFVIRLTNGIIPTQAIGFSIPRQTPTIMKSIDSNADLSKQAIIAQVIQHMPAEIDFTQEKMSELYHLSVECKNNSLSQDELIAKVRNLRGDYFVDKTTGLAIIATIIILANNANGFQSNPHVNILSHLQWLYGKKYPLGQFG